MDNRYKIFRNFMANELQITRDDIKLWCKEAIQDITKKLIEQINIKELILKEIKDRLNYGTSTISKEIANELSKRIKIEITE
jgi:hypothetical protein